MRCLWSPVRRDASTWTSISTHDYINCVVALSHARVVVVQHSVVGGLKDKHLFTVGLFRGPCGVDTTALNYPGVIVQFAAT